MGADVTQNDSCKPVVKKKWQHALWVFCKAQISSYCASLVDFLITIVLAKFASVFYLYATFLGAVSGGVINAVINYRWVFEAKGLKKRYVALKYLMVWSISILLNTWGTYGLTEWLKSMGWVHSLLGYFVDDVFILSKLIVAVMVSVIWNYQMQRAFVYKQRNLDKFIWKLMYHKDKHEL